jgi:hypothetical protein
MQEDDRKMMMVYRIRSFVAGLILFGALSATLFSFLATMAVVLDRMPLVIPALIVVLSLQSMKMGLPVVIHHLWVKRAATLRDVVAVVWLAAFATCATAAFMFAAGPHVVHDRAAAELLASKETALKSMRRALDWEEQEYTVALSYEKRVNTLAREISELRAKPAKTIAPPNLTGQFLGLIAVLNELLSASGLLLLRLATAHSDERLAPEPVPAPAPPVVVDTASEPVELLPAPYSGPAFLAASARVDPSKATAWLWPGVLPLGALTLLSGQPKAGKSTIAVHMAAVTSAGGAWPTGESCASGGVILLEVEDSFADTQLRLAAAGADLSRVVVRDREQGPIDLSTAEGMAVLTGQADAMGGARLVVLSPVLAFFGKSVGGDDAALRARIAPLLLWAARNKVAVLGLLHPAKNAGKALEAQFAGADAYRRAARSAFVVTPDASDPNPVEKRKRRVLVCAGVNGASDDFRLLYRIEGATVGGQSTSRVAWMDDAAAQAGTNAPPPNGDDRGESSDAGDTDDANVNPGASLDKLVVALLADGPRSRKAVLAAAQAAGWRSNGSLYAAAKRVGVVFSEKSGFGGETMWSLPIVQSSEAPEGA